MRDDSRAAESKPSYEQMKKLACGEEAVQKPSGVSENILSFGMIIFCAFLKF